MSAPELKIIEWAEPPPREYNGGRPAGHQRTHEEVVAALKGNPEQWAVIAHMRNARMAQQLTTRINTGRINAFTAEHGLFEAVSRAEPDSTFVVSVYARYVPS